MTVRAGLAIGLLAAAPGPAAVAARIPLTALSHSLQMRSELLLQDEASQYLFPQLAAGAPSALFGFGANAGRTVVAGSGVRAALDGSSLSFLLQDSVPFATAGEEAPVFQVGLARGSTGLRLGGAYAWSVLGDRFRRTTTGSEVERATSEFLTLVHHEASLGIGWGDDASVDVVGQVRWEWLHHRFRETTRSSTESLLRRSDLTVDGDLLPGVASRARVPLASWLRLVGFGSYRELSFDVVQTTRTESEGSGVNETRETVHDRGQWWSAGAALEAGERWWLALHGFWESTRGPARHGRFRLDTESSRSEVEALRIGASGAHQLGRVTTLHAGWSMTHRDESTVQEFGGFGTFIEGNHVRSVSHDFGWGATHTFWFIDLTGSAAHDLKLGNLFLLLDVRARF